ncbi:hypothetical protein [Chitinophaga filiformis]|uniref:NlpE N-terminal domain-containing protein n=1 Tax=Chitinophaga filiformis TaxID=104663 RepID=A0A1G7UB23_CHIFI|nr:hypothetical protein [Chitinophaga filiformis]SDG44776.1 hypothetical protein SAMN04488121_104304 [Chitinophaga filiformis]
MKPYFVAAALLTMFSCQQPSGNTPETDQQDTSTVTVTAPASTPVQQCYIKISGKDTSYLQFSTNNEVIDGQLEYHLFEKDKNEGAIRGTIANNIITADYDFMSEGSLSKRPVVFKLENDKVFEAIPSSFDAEGVPVFDKDQSKLKFEDVPFVKGNCK